MRPAGITDADWNVEFSYIQSEAGPTWGGVIRLLSRLATFAASQGDPNANSVQVLFGYALGDALEHAHASATGTLYFSDTDHPLANTELILFGPSTAPGGTVTNPDGSFVIDDLPSGTYDVEINGYSVLGPSTVEISPFGPTTGLSIFATSPSSSITGAIENAHGTISGSVSSAVDNSLLPGVSVLATNSDDQTMYQATTDALGDYSLLGLTDGSYTLAIGGGSLETQYLGNLFITDGGSLQNENATLEPGATLTGQVLSGGTAVANAVVQLTDVNGNFVSTTTDSGGNYSISALSGGPYIEEVQAPGFGPSASSVSLTTGVAATAPVVSLFPGDDFAVSVVDSSSSPVADAIVQLGQNNQATIALPVNTQGQALFSDLDDGIYQVEISAAGMAPLNSVVTLADGAVVSQTYTLLPGDAITGLVIDGNGSPISSIMLHLSGQDSAGTPYNQETVTATDGTYSFTGLPDGTYFVSAGNLAGIDQQQASLTAAEPKSTLNFAIAGAVVTGTVLAADGTTPVDLASVFVVQNGRAIVEAETGASGDFTVRGLAAGAYTLFATTGMGLTPAETITVAANATSTTGTLDFGNQSFTGRLVDAAGQPIASATVAVEPGGISDIPPASLATSNAQGDFTIPGLAPGQYILVMNAAGFVTQTQALSVSGASVAPQTFTLAAGVTVSAAVLDAGTGHGIAQALVSFYDPSTHAVVTEVVASDNGSYTARLAPGTYDAIATAPGYQMVESQGLTITSNTPAPSFSLPIAATTLQGTVVDSGGLGLSNALVDVVNSLGETVQSLASGASGSYAVAGLPPGNYTIQASFLGYLPQQVANITLGSGATVMQNIAMVAAGTDELPPPSSYGGGSTYPVFSSVAQTAQANVQGPHPLPGDPNFSPVPPKAGPCPAAEQARRNLLVAAKNVEAAYNRWAVNFNNYEDTKTYNNLIAGLDAANVAASLAGTLATGQLGQQLQLADLETPQRHGVRS